MCFFVTHCRFGTYMVWELYYDYLEYLGLKAKEPIYLFFKYGIFGAQINQINEINIMTSTCRLA